MLRKTCAYTTGEKNKEEQCVLFNEKNNYRGYIEIEILKKASLRILFRMWLKFELR